MSAFLLFVLEFPLILTNTGHKKGSEAGWQHSRTPGVRSLRYSERSDASGTVRVFSVICVSTIGSARAHPTITAHVSTRTELVSTRISGRPAQRHQAPVSKSCVGVESWCGRSWTSFEIFEIS